MIAALQFLVGSASLVIASAVYWRIGQPDAMSERWRNMPGMDLLIVAVVLGGWAAGVSLIIYGAALIFSA